MSTGYDELVERILEKIPEDGALPRDDVRVWHNWHEYLVNILGRHNLSYRGESFKDQGWSTLLVVKTARQGIPYVAFCTERNPTACMRVFLRLLAEDRVIWKEDKFAGT